MSSSRNLRFLAQMAKVAALRDVEDSPLSEEYGACPLCGSTKARLVAESEDGFREVECEEGHKRPLPAGKVKTASLADAVLGAPLGALASVLSTKKEDRTAAVKRGLLLGALVGFVQGQRANKKMEKGEEERVMSPALASLLSGIAAGVYGRRNELPLIGRTSEPKK